MTPELRNALQSWYDWATNGAPDREPFWRSSGLCSAVRDFSLDLEFELAEMLRAKFGADWVYPFGVFDFNDRLRAATQHECPKRLAWVRKTLGIGE